MKTILATAAVLFAAAASSVSAQQPPIAPAPIPPPPGAAPTEIGRNPSATYLMERYGISEAEALKRIGLQTQIVELSQRLNTENDPAFSSVTIEHEPVYKITVSFSDNKDRRVLLESIDPSIRRYVQLRTVPRSRGQRGRDLARLAAELRPSGVRFIPGFDQKTQTYVIDVGSQVDADRLSTLVPAELKEAVRFNIRPLPEPHAAPTGVQAGDWVAGGYAHYGSTSGSNQCTMGFTVTYGSGARGILTSSHCNDPRYTYHGHWVTYPTPYVYELNSGSYDYQLHETTGLNSDYQIYFQDKNGIPEFPAEGWFSVKNIIYWANQLNGVVMCKSGAVTGITCGEIIDDWYMYRGDLPWIKIGHTKQYDISAPGDSGGPWFMYPGSSVDVTAAGIHTAGSGTGSSSIAVYMPIDRIDDHVTSVRLILKP